MTKVERQKLEDLKEIIMHSLEQVEATYGPDAEALTSISLGVMAYLALDEKLKKEKGEV